MPFGMVEYVRNSFFVCAHRDEGKRVIVARSLSVKGVFGVAELAPRKLVLLGASGFTVDKETAIRIKVEVE